MNCREMEELIALYVSGEMVPREEHIVEEHLAACEDCSRLAAGLRADLEELRKLRTAPADESALAAVRLSVLDELESRRARTLSPFDWILASSNVRWAVLAVALVLAAFIGTDWLDRTQPSPTMDPQPLASVAVANPTASTAKALVKEVEATSRRHEVLQAKAGNQPSAVQALPDDRRPATHKPGPPAKPVERRIEVVDSNAVGSPLYPQATLVKLSSSDPNVVLYWLVESNGG